MDVRIKKEELVLMFESFPTQEVSLLKQNGQRIDGIEAHVQSKVIFIEDVSVPIEEADKIIRVLPNGLFETYVVLDRGYFDAVSPRMGAHYQVKVKKETTLRMETKSVTNSYNNCFNNNEKVNFESQDHSINFKIESNQSQFAELKETIKSQIINETEQQELLTVVTELEDNVGSSNYGESYKKFISVAADHMTVVAPFLPLLTQFI